MEITCMQTQHQGVLEDRMVENLLEDLTRAAAMPAYAATYLLCGVEEQDL